MQPNRRGSSPPCSPTILSPRSSSPCAQRRSSTTARSRVPIRTPGAIYFTDNAEVTHQSLRTIAHELAHAHGRNHAPCALKGGTIAGVDPGFPERTGATSSWGWDSRTSTLHPPTDKDIMGYCMPDWISAYTYAAIAKRSLQVNNLPLVSPGSDLTRWHNVLLYDDGSTRWGGLTETTTPGGTRQPGTVLDSAGQRVATIDIIRLTLSESSNEILYLPDLSPTWSTLVLSDRTLDLHQIQPAR